MLLSRGSPVRAGKVKSGGPAKGIGEGRRCFTSFHWPPEPHCVVCCATTQTFSNRQGREGLVWGRCTQMDSGCDGLSRLPTHPFKTAKPRCLLLGRFPQVVMN